MAVSSNLPSLIGGILCPLKTEDSIQHSHDCDLFIVVGSSLVVYPAADMPRLALDNGAKLVIINQGGTPYDSQAHLHFSERIADVLPPAVERLKELMGKGK